MKLKSPIDRNLLRSLILLIPFGAVALVAPFASANPNQSNASGLNNQQKLLLKSLGIAIALPSYVPKGFRVADVQVTPCPANAPQNAKGVCRSGPSYTIVYHNWQNNCFEVNAIGGGIGGPDGKYSRKVNSAILGEVDLNIDVSRWQRSQPISEV
ncbi:MAG: hypothetical protein ACKPCM_07350, partial [Pseudanabaena sp.]